MFEKFLFQKFRRKEFAYLSLNEEQAERALSLLYAYWSESVKPVERVKDHDYMKELLGRQTGRDFTQMQKWENKKIKQWTKEGRLMPNGHLLTYEQKKNRVSISGGSI